MNRKIFIYGLRNINTNEYRYIGRTFTPKKRLGEHLREKSKKNSYKLNWIASSLKKNINIVLDILEEVDETNWREKERAYIKHYRDIGHRLTNLADGGEDFYREFKYDISYANAKEIIKGLGIKTTLEWRKKSKNNELPKFIPKRPDLHYLYNGWVSWSDWLGLEIVSNKNKQFLNYEDAAILVKKLNIKSNNCWREYCNNGSKPKEIPSNPDLYYKNNGWVSWSHWLEYNKVKMRPRPEFLSYEEAKNIVNKLGLKTHKDWVNFSKTNRPKNIPANPWKIYKEWKGIKDFINN